jgi:hypothetical protein
MLKTRDCNAAVIQGRLANAVQFYTLAEAARDDSDLGNAFVSNCVLAGIAAADVLCCVSLGVHAQGDDHAQAIKLLERVVPGGKDLGRSLATLIALKNDSSYGYTPMSADDRKRAQRAAEKLLAAARDRAK